MGRDLATPVAASERSTRSEFRFVEVKGLTVVEQWINERRSVWRDGLTGWEHCWPKNEK
jgi:hypothetical protein